MLTILAPKLRNSSAFSSIWFFFLVCSSCSYKYENNGKLFWSKNHNQYIFLKRYSYNDVYLANRFLFCKKTSFTLINVVWQIVACLFPRTFKVMNTRINILILHRIHGPFQSLIPAIFQHSTVDNIGNIAHLQYIMILHF